MQTYGDGTNVTKLPLRIERTPEVMKKYIKAWLIFVFFSVFLAITTALMLATNSCAGQAAVVLGWATLAIHVFVFIGVLVVVLRPTWAIPIFRENLRWLEVDDPRISQINVPTTPVQETVTTVPSETEPDNPENFNY